MKQSKRLPKIFSPSVKVLKSDDDKTVFRVVGIPYGGPEYLGGKDLHGEFFAPDTDYGKDENGEVVVKTIYAYYDHALNDAIGRDNIGYAKFYQENQDEGQIWDIEVRRAYRYHDMLLALAEKNLLGASSQPVQTAVDIDWESGKIKQWHPVEISLTTSPANPNAVAEVMKSFNLELDEGKMKKKTEEDVKEDVEQVEESETSTLAEDIENVFDETEGDVDLDVSEIKSMLTDILTQLGELKSAQSKTLEGQVELVKELGIVKSGLKTFAANVAKRLRMEVKTIADENEQMSDEERNVKNELEKESKSKTTSRSPIPAHAPGR